MPANHKVSAGWQIVFTFLPIVNFWAFYRIRKLRKYVLYLVVPEIIASIILVAYISNIGLWVPYGDDGLAFGNPGQSVLAIFSNIVGWGLQGFAIYLVIIWSRKHNQQFDQPPTQAGLPQ